MPSLNAMLCWILYQIILLSRCSFLNQYCSIAIFRFNWPGITLITTISGEAPTRVGNATIHFDLPALPLLPKCVER